MKKTLNEYLQSWDNQSNVFYFPYFMWSNIRYGYTTAERASYFLQFDDIIDAKPLPDDFLEIHATMKGMVDYLNYDFSGNGLMNPEDEYMIEQLSEYLGGVDVQSIGAEGVAKLLQTKHGDLQESKRNNMKKQTIKLKESQLRNIIKKSINEAVCEDEYDLPWTDREPKNDMDKLRLSRYNGLVEIIEYYSAQEDDGKPLSKEQYEQLKNVCDTLECFGEPGQKWAEFGREILSRNEHASMNESQLRKIIKEVLDYASDKYDYSPDKGWHLKESKLNKIIKESIKKVLKEEYLNDKSDMQSLVDVLLMTKQNNMTDYEVFIKGFKFLVHWNSNRQWFEGTMMCSPKSASTNHIYAETINGFIQKVEQAINNAMVYYNDGGKY